MNLPTDRPRSLSCHGFISIPERGLGEGKLGHGGLIYRGDGCVNGSGVWVLRGTKRKGNTRLRLRSHLG